MYASLLGSVASLLASLPTIVYIARFCEVMSQGSRKLLIGHMIAGVLPVFAVEACKGDSVFQTLEEWPTVATTSRHLWKIYININTDYTTMWRIHSWIPSREVMSMCVSLAQSSVACYYTT